MNAFRDMRIGLRLGLGFGTLLVLMAAVIGLSAWRLQHLGERLQQVVDEDWTRASTVARIDTLTRANARRTMELLLVTEPEPLAAVRGHVRRNKQHIDEALALLDRLVEDPAGVQMLAALKADRAAYVASFSQVDRQVQDDQREAARTTLLSQTLPAIDRLQQRVSTLSDHQQALAHEASVAAQAEVRQTRWVLGLAGLGMLALGAGAAWSLSRAITRPLGQAVAMAEAVAAGDLRAATGSQARDETGRLLQALKAMNDSLAQVVREVRQGSESIATGSGQMAGGAADLSQRTEEQAANLQQTAASMEQLAATVRQSAQTAQEASTLASRASATAAQGGAVVQQVVGTMEDISQSSRRIGDIVGVIDGIAFQTNILALNAAVEAARAGEQGRGFAVVASEVRSLAQRSATSAREIKQLIQASVEKVEAGTQLVDTAGRTMQDIVTQVAEASRMIAQISTAAGEQTQGIGQVNDAVAQLDQVTQQNAALVEESAAASESLKQQAALLVDTVRIFRLDGVQAA